MSKGGTAQSPQVLLHKFFMWQLTLVLSLSKASLRLNILLLSLMLAALRWATVATLLLVFLDGWWDPPEELAFPLPGTLHSVTEDELMFSDSFCKMYMAINISASLNFGGTNWLMFYTPFHKLYHLFVLKVLTTLPAPAAPLAAAAAAATAADPHSSHGNPASSSWCLPGWYGYIAATPSHCGPPGYPGGNCCPPGWAGFPALAVLLSHADSADAAAAAKKLWKPPCIVSKSTAGRSTSLWYYQKRYL